MNSPWQILGLDPGSATEKDVKTAYARLIKQHRPDSDPEGFQRVRQAYEAALAMLKNGRFQEGTRDEDHGPSFDKPESPEPRLLASQPPALIEAELAIGKAREDNDQLALVKTIGELQRLCESLRPGRAGLQLWQDTLHRVTEGKAALVALGVPIPQLLKEMENASAAVTHAVIGHWEGTEQIDNLELLAEAIVTDLGRLQNREAAIVALRLGIEVAFVRPVLAPKLITFAFPHVDREAREALIPKIEEQAAIGRLMPGLRRDQQHFWHKRIRFSRTEWDWDSEESRQALDYLAGKVVPQWSGFAIVKQVVPQDWFARLEKELSRRQGGLTGRFRTIPLGKARVVPKTSKWKGWGRFAWLFFVLVSVVSRLLPDLGPVSSTSKLSPPNHYTPVPDYSRLYAPHPVPVAIPGHSSPSTSELDQKMSRVDAALKKFQQDIGAQGNTESAAKARADKLRAQDKSMHVWLDSANSIEAKATALSKTATTEKKKAIYMQSRKDLYALMQDLHKSSRDVNVEQRFLEAMLFDPETSMDERDIALIRMIEIEPLDALLPVWEEASALLPMAKLQVAGFAAFYLKTKKTGLLDSERQRLEVLAKP